MLQDPSTSRHHAPARRLRRAMSKVGQAPGTAVYTGETSNAKISSHAFIYSEEDVQEGDIASGLREIASDRGNIVWIDVVGVHNLDVVREVSEALSLHPLVVEDILDPGGRVKFEDYGSYEFVIAKMVHPHENGAPGSREHVAFVRGPNWVVSFQEREGDLFGPLRDRIREGGGRVRRMDSYYLLHGLLDAIVDGYVVEAVRFDVEASALEARALGGTDDTLPRVIHEKRESLTQLLRVVSPIREVARQLARACENDETSRTAPYFRDLEDHALLAVDALDTARTQLGSVLDLHLAMNSQRMNTVMRTLTVFATIFMPLTFIVGVYGMNFHGMPELTAKWGYPAVWALMIGTTVIMYLWTRRKGWLD